MSHTDICISIKDVSYEAEFWISAFKIQESLIKMRVSVFEMRYPIFISVFQLKISASQ